MKNLSDKIENPKKEFEDLGKRDGFVGLDETAAQAVITAESERAVNSRVSKEQSRIAWLKSRATIVNNYIKMSAQAIERLSESIKSIGQPKVISALLLYIIPALFYILGDIMFSKELIVTGWGLGNAVPMEKWILAIAIGLAPFYLKFVVDRFMEPHLRGPSVTMKRAIVGIHVVLSIFMLFSFLQVAYVRAIIFKYTKISISGNAYDILYQNHSAAMIVIFILVAFMFAVGGGVLLSLGSVHLVKGYEKMKSKKLLKKEKIYHDNLLDESISISSEFEELRITSMDPHSLENEISTIKNEYNYYYQRGYKTGLKDRSEDFKRREPNISAYMRQSMDKKARNIFIDQGSYAES